MTELTVHAINARTRLVEDPGGWCALHPTRFRVAIAQGRGVYNDLRAAAVFDLRHMRTVAAWETVCATQRLYWAGDRVLEAVEFAREHAAEGDSELIVRELPDGGEVARCEVDALHAPQVSHDARSVFLSGQWRGALRELPGLDLVSELGQPAVLAKHGLDARLHPDGHCVAVVREGSGSWQLVVRGFDGTEKTSDWCELPWSGAMARAARAEVQWIGPRSVLVALAPVGQSQRDDLRWIWTLDEDNGAWSRRAPIDALMGGPWAQRYDLSPRHGQLAVAAYASGAATSLCVVDPRSGRLKAHRPWDTRDGALDALRWMDANRIALCALVEGVAHALYVWDLRTDAIRQRATGFEDARRFAYCGFREGHHVLRVQAGAGPGGVLLIEDTGELSPNERAPAR